MQRTDFSYLLVAVLTFLIFVPLADDFIVGRPPVIRALQFSTILVIGVWSLRGSGRLFPIGMAFVAAGIVLSVATARSNSAVFQYLSLAALVGFLLLAIAHTFRQVAFGTDLSVNRLVGAICVYLLLGVIWALSYSVLELAAPGSFAGFNTHAGHGWHSEWLYFSFVTMTTLGYGDLSPISATARAMAYMQAVFGQFYIAILVAGLVGAYIARKNSS